MHQNPSLRILVVDDDTDSADLLAEAMTLMGYEAVAAYSGETALTIASAYLPHIALIDLVMPDIDGYAVAAKLKQSPSTHGTRLIAVTAAADALSRRRAIASGFSELIVKPAAVGLVVEAIENGNHLVYHKSS